MWNQCEVPLHNLMWNRCGIVSQNVRENDFLIFGFTMENMKESKI